MKVIKIFFVLFLSFYQIKHVHAHALSNAEREQFKIGDPLDIDIIKFIDGKEFNLKEYRDKKIVLLFFWSYYFKDYKDSLIMMSELHSEYKDKHIIFLGINLDSKKKKCKKILNK